MPSRIEDYALIGDCETAALVGRNGSIDWLCLPRFDSPACFAALLGTPEHGRWQIAPATEPKAIRRRYRGDTLVVETEFETDEGVVALIDAMPLRSGTPMLARLVEGRRGRVPLRMELVIRFDYGTRVPWVRRQEDGLSAVSGPDALRLRTPVELVGRDLRTIAEFTVGEGERVPFVMAWYRSHEPEPPALDAVTCVTETERFWSTWCARCDAPSEWREAIVRSLITLKALTYTPTGGLVAAVTTSLPEQLGGVRNWDYRFCWLRDATFALYALMTGGYVDEALAWRDWLLRAVAGAPAQAQIMYGLAGERRLSELELRELPGYEGAAPVRIGNAAHAQFQLDVYGEVLDTLYVARRAGLPPDENAWRVERALVEFVEKEWREPDEGIWEVRGPRRHFTHSKVMAWVALDRAVKDCDRFGLPSEALAQWRRCRAEIHAEICARGFDADLGAFVQSYGSKLLDASLLMLPLVGFLPARDPRVIGTVKAIEGRLLEDGFVRRYETDPGVDGLPAGEGAFLACTFWLADNLVLQGRDAEARAIFERLLSLRNDVGLLSEEYDVRAKRLVGNFPQGFSHVGVINTARNLSRNRSPAEQRRRT
jgi:GH15 family glucan-1,4-alpha-glucosidase